MFKRIYNDTAALHSVDHSLDEPLQVEVLKKDTVNPDDVLFKVIYSLDPETGLPKGDLQMFLSVDTSPEVKDFIQKNLLRPSAEKPKDSGLSVDEMNALSRHPGEQRDAYISRMNDYFASMREANKVKTNSNDV